MHLIALAQQKQDISRCYPVMAQLRPQYSLQEFVTRVEDQMRDGYHLAYLIDNNIVKSVAGFRIGRNLAWGKFLYVDDLVSDSQFRHTGVGTALFEWLVDYAHYNQCEQLHLDSGVQRHAAHRFYMRRGMDISAHHFALNLG